MVPPRYTPFDTLPLPIEWRQIVMASGEVRAVSFDQNGLPMASDQFEMLYHTNFDDFVQMLEAAHARGRTQCVIRSEKNLTTWNNLINDRSVPIVIFHSIL